MSNVNEYLADAEVNVKYMDASINRALNATDEQDAMVESAAAQAYATAALAFATMAQAAALRDA